MKILVLLLMSTSAWADGVTLVPSDPAALDQFLQKLTTDHRPQRWCNECVTLYNLEIAGTLKTGEFTFTATGAVSGDTRAIVRLFAAKPALHIEAGATPLYWTGDSYAAALEPGSFTLRGRLHAVPTEPLTLVVPGPVGRVDFQVTDADIIGSALRRGVRNGTYQLVPMIEGARQEAPAVLRLQVERTFHLARDRTFAVNVSARGARPGQVIALPVATGEAIDDLDPRLATLSSDGARRRLDWVAQSTEPTLRYAGKWSENNITLAAPEGPVREAWEVECDDPYLCDFEGNAETRPGASGHTYTPLPGQSLRIRWRELQPMAGAHTVAQVVAISTHAIGDSIKQQLNTHAIGDRIKQQLNVEWRSSSGGRVWLVPPPDAALRSFKLNDTTVPILKDERGAVHVQLPSGTSQLAAEWEIADQAGITLRPPVPQLSHPVATLWHVVSPPQHHTVLLAGGIPGSPRTTFWPDLAATLLVATVTWWLARRSKRPLKGAPLWFASAAGFAILSPAALLPLVFLVGAIRLLGHATTPRGVLRTLVELGAVAGVLLAALGCAFAALEHVLFGASPIDIHSFVSNHQIPGLTHQLKLFWAAFLGGAPDVHLKLPTPWVVTVPTLAIRLVWTAWAVALAVFCVKESPVALDGLRHYWRTRGSQTS